MKEKDWLKQLISKPKCVLGVLFIAITNQKPVLVFKEYRGPLCKIEQKSQNVQGRNVVYGDRVTSCVSYWKGEFLYNKFPSVVHQNYPSKFTQTIELQKDFSEEPKIRMSSDGHPVIPLCKLYNDYDAVKNTKEAYNPDDLPPRCHELELAPILEGKFEGMKSSEKEKYKSARSVFQQCDFISDGRGKGGRKVDSVRKMVKKYIIDEYKKLKKRKPLPIKILSRKLVDYVNTLFPNDEETAEKYYYSDATIRRIIQALFKSTWQYDI